MRACLLAMLAVIIGLIGTPAHAASDCTDEAAALVKEETDLPRLEVVSPRDPPPYCITLETIIAFSRRLAMHVEHCPGSAYASAAGGWSKTRTDYARLFARHGCRRAIPN